MPSAAQNIIIKNAYDHNLKHIDVQIPLQKITVITGLSGSGKSSLVYQILFKESQRRFLESFSSYSKQFIGKMEEPKVEEIIHLPAAQAIDQKSAIRNPRSTVGTLSGIYDFSRMIYARFGNRKCTNCGTDFSASVTQCPECYNKTDKFLAKSFSFNAPSGACKICNGLGITEQIDPHKLIADENKSLAEGALIPTTPTGYIVYSQVRVDELDKVCKAHGFSVDIPWNQLSKEQQDVIWYGSDRVKILFGKHSLESRLKWKGITAKPREESYYKGMIPIMDEILKRDRNDNILRFASSGICNSCAGSRINEAARSVQLSGKSIDELSELSLLDLQQFLQRTSSKLKNSEEFKHVFLPLLKRLEQVELLGLSHLSLSRSSNSLSGGEIQRLRLASQLSTGMQGILYILDEPSIGLHAIDQEKLISVVRNLKAQGNTVVIVEHEEAIINAADFIIEMGPKAGIYGGEVCFQGTLDDYFKRHQESVPTALDIPKSSSPVSSWDSYIKIKNANKFHLKNIDVAFKTSSLNVVTGVSGAGKSTLVHQVLAPLIRKSIKNENPPHFESQQKISKLIEIDQSPIGKTPRSNPATYTDLFDHIRDLYAKQELSKVRKYKKGRFSFNNKGGRCEECEGAGAIQLGMHFLGNVENVCPVCHGKRFNKETLEVEYKGKNIYDVLDLSIEEASHIFNSEPKISSILEILMQLEVGYLKLGQSSTSLSGGEAQRIKLASELYKSHKNHSVYILNEPSTGLHKTDVRNLLQSIFKIIDQGHTFILIEHDLDIIEKADHIVDLGPGAGVYGGHLVYQGGLKGILECEKSKTGKALLNWKNKKQVHLTSSESQALKNIELRGLNTHNLQNIDVEIPIHKTTVITGLSGSGKTSLAFDSLYTESRNRFTENYSSYARRMLSKLKKADLDRSSGLTPAIAIRQQKFQKNPRSTVGTYSGIYDLFRLLFSRFGIDKDGNQSRYSMSDFSFNNPDSACKRCNGTGELPFANPDRFISNPDLPISKGAMDGSKAGKFFGDFYGQYVQTLLQVGKELNIDFGVAYKDLSEKAKQIALYGTGEQAYEVEWEFKRGNRSGTHQLKTKWKGFANELLEDFLLKKDGKRGEQYIGLIDQQICNSCNGDRLKPNLLNVFVLNKNITQFTKLSVIELSSFIPKIQGQFPNASQIAHQLQEKLQQIENLGLAYLELNRPIDSLSNGEAQRLRIASQLNSNLCNLTYILDEPSSGLHLKDLDRLLVSLEKLKEKQNTLVLVEHNGKMIKSADHIIEMGPGAGENGGNIVFEGALSEISSSHHSDFYHTFIQTDYSFSSSKTDFATGIVVSNAHAHNLKNINLKIPKNAFVCISGVSGSGKSSLLFDCIAPSFQQKRNIQCDNIEFYGIKHISLMDQNAIGTSSNSNIATYTDIFESIKTIFSKTEEAKKTGIKKSYFSFNSKDGCCPQCKGSGKIKISLDFLADVWQECDVCHGKRYVDKVLNIKYKNLAINQVLELSIQEAIPVFEENKNIQHALKTLIKSGLGYLRLGQGTNTLSGGELQRLKLAKELINSEQKDCLFIFDEPGTGLHPTDIKNLIGVFRELVNNGNTVIIIEHKLDFLLASDWIVDLGPDGGPNGGTLLYSGPSEKIMDVTVSHTATSIKQMIYR